MSDGDKKLYELTLNADGLRFRRADPHPLTAEQKYDIARKLLLLAAAALCAGFVWAIAALCDVPGLLITLAVISVLALIGRGLN